MKFLKWLLPLSFIVIYITYRKTFGDQLLLVGVIIELALVIIIIIQALRTTKKYKDQRKYGKTFFIASEESLSLIMPSIIAKMCLHEIKIFYCLWIWITQRKHYTNTDFSYHKHSILGSLLIAIVFLTFLEIILFEIFLPILWLKWLLLVASIYGLLWIIGFYASLIVLPHKVSKHGVHIYFGLSLDTFIPFKNLASIEYNKHQWDTASTGIIYTKKNNQIALTIDGRTDITIALQSPITVQTILKKYSHVSKIHVAVDNPHLFLEITNSNL